MFDLQRSPGMYYRGLKYGIYSDFSQKTQKMALSPKLDHFYKDIYEGKLFQKHYISVL